jgi:ATP-binding cassette subfamily C protein CydD
MEVLRLAFLSSGVLEFFASLSIALVAVYFGFSYLGELNFGHYGTGVTLFSGFLTLILAPEFFQPLRDLGTFYHAKAQAIGAADSLQQFMDSPQHAPEHGTRTLNSEGALNLEARDLVVLSPTGVRLAGPLSFTLNAGARVALVGQSGAGKSSLLNLLSGFLPYEGSLTVNGIELRELDPDSLRARLSWLGQNPRLPGRTLRDNILLADPTNETRLKQAIDDAYVSEFLTQLPHGLDSELGENAASLSVGQAQRVALARALIVPCGLLLLDEPVASLDAHSEELVMEALERAARRQTTLMVTHQLDVLQTWDDIWVMQEGRIVQQGNWQRLAQEEGPFARLLAHRQEEI